MVGDMSYKIIRDQRLPKLIKHSEICYPPPHPDFIDKVDTTYPGIVVEYPNGYQIEDGVHRIACLLYTSPSPRDKRQSRMPSSA